MKAIVISRLATFATCPRGEFEDDFESVNIKISEFKKLSNLPLEENIHFNSIIILTKPL